MGHFLRLAGPPRGLVNRPSKLQAAGVSAALSLLLLWMWPADSRWQQSASTCSHAKRSGYPWRRSVESEATTELVRWSSSAWRGWGGRGAAFCCGLVQPSL